MQASNCIICCGLAAHFARLAWQRSENKVLFKKRKGLMASHCTESLENLSVCHLLLIQSAGRLENNV